MVKPYNLDEFVARVSALLRRIGQENKHFENRVDYRYHCAQSVCTAGRYVVVAQRMLDAENIAGQPGYIFDIGIAVPANMGAADQR